MEPRVAGRHWASPSAALDKSGLSRIGLSPFVDSYSSNRLWSCQQSKNDFRVEVYAEICPRVKGQRGVSLRFTGGQALIRLMRNGRALGRRFWPAGCGKGGGCSPPERLLTGPETWMSGGRPMRRARTGRRSARSELGPHPHAFVCRTSHLRAWSLELRA